MKWRSANIKELKGLETQATPRRLEGLAPQRGAGAARGVRGRAGAAEGAVQHLRWLGWSYRGFLKQEYPQSSSIFIGFFTINHPFWGTPIYGNPHILISKICCGMVFARFYGDMEKKKTKRNHNIIYIYDIHSYVFSL